ncbi:MAG: insulinase family protein [Ruminococcaceae bacterium]|nr:insulinase family protein [Oscillospiraceae bacterium]
MNGVKKIQIYPSVKLTAVPSSKFKTAYLSVCFTRPLCEKEAAMNALIPEILTRSCKKYPTMLSLGVHLQSLYGASVEPMNISMGENHLFGLYASFTENRFTFDKTDVLSEIIDLISEMILNPLTEGNSFDKSVLESEKEKLCGRILSRINNPAAYALRRCEEIMCEGERFAVSTSGTLESVSQVSGEELYAYYLSLKNCAQINICYAGSEDIGVLADKLKTVFSDFNSKIATAVPTEVKRRADGDIKTVIEEEKVSQGKLTIGFRSGFALSDEDYHVFALTNALLGASPTSKLFMNVREKLGLCYYCSSRPNALKGTLTVSSGIEVDDFEKTRDAIFEQINALKSGDITDFELESAKKSLINSYRELTDSHSGLVFWYLTRSFANRSDSPSEVAEKIALVTKEEIVDAAKKISPDTVYFLKGTLKSAGSTEDEEDIQ